MSRFVAFLRGINVGGHRVKMAELKRLFERLKFKRVETFIASGNVIFETAETDATALETRIEAHLERALGYAISTFLRTPAELAAITAHRPFSPEDMEAPTHSVYVIFFSERISAKAVEQLVAMRTPVDEFAVRGREAYWLCRGKISVDSLAAPLLQKAKGPPSTMRNLTTVRALSELLAAEPEPAPAKRRRAAR